MQLIQLMNHYREGIEGLRQRCCVAFVRASAACAQRGRPCGHALWITVRPSSSFCHDLGVSAEWYPAATGWATARGKAHHRVHEPNPLSWQAAYRAPSTYNERLRRSHGGAATIGGVEMARHVLGVLGVIAAGVLLVVSAAMNYRFGFSLGKTAQDGHIYGMASAAADCFKALVPFFFFAALRNRMWSQAMAAVVVWCVVTAYSLTSALGHAALNRLDTTGQRAVAAAGYQDLRADSKRAHDQLTWIPAHRPSDTVAAELNVLKAQRGWAVTKQCTEVTGRSSRDFCQQFHKLSAELASGQQAQKLEARIAELGTKLAGASGGTVMAEADPQASVLAKLTGLEVDKVQTALTLFIAVLIEIGSGFGMYVAFAYWRMHGPMPVAARGSSTSATVSEAETVRTTPVWSDETAAEPEAAQTAAQPPPVRRLGGANDNRTPAGRPIVPESDVQRYYRERVVAAAETASLTSSELYEDYCKWCEEKERIPFAHPRVTREIADLGVKKERIGKRTRYFGIALASKLPAALPRAA
jgi:hypothetical protein